MFVRNVRGRQHQQERPEELLTPMFVGRWATSEPLTAKIVHQQAVGLTSITLRYGANQRNIGQARLNPAPQLLQLNPNQSFQNAS
jgi:hypothetical protein